MAQSVSMQESVSLRPGRECRAPHEGSNHLGGGLEEEFLDAPVKKFGDVEFVFRRAGDFVNPAELFWLFAGLAEDAEDFSVKGQLVDAAGKCVGAKQNLVRPRGNTDRPGRARSH